MLKSTELTEYLKQKIIPTSEDTKLSDHTEYSFLLEARDRFYRKRMVKLYQKILGKQDQGSVSEGS